ncbi:DoxX family protein [Psychroflexus maritimus]|uniref:DoxX family protein n=1 Tax=Psychroflexus maritimus TaxID=2714865 RepID=A0A967AE67_9FLAO|nr:DoxX family protein [Psychroflexus maritimus]NGZ90431.1 DoxX family protein [Psychroflexus maritimus]
MEYLKIIIQVIVAATIFNVWLFRFNKSTPFRGADAPSMKKEFEVYGLNETMMYLVGGLKLLFAIGLIAGIFLPSIVEISAAGIGFLMLGAIGMHIKVKDEPKKSFPAFTMLILSLAILVI